MSIKFELDVDSIEDKPLSQREDIIRRKIEELHKIERLVKDLVEETKDERHEEVRRKFDYEVSHNFLD